MNIHEYPEWDYESGKYEKRSKVIEREYTCHSQKELAKFEDSFGRIAEILKYSLDKFKSRKLKIERRTKKAGRLNPLYVSDELKKLYNNQELTDRIYDRHIRDSKKHHSGRIVGLLLDQSGSTRFDAGEYTRIELIKYAALTLGRSLDNIDDPFFMYSFHSSEHVHPTYMERLKDVGEEWTGSLESRIAALEHTANTDDYNDVDGAAIRHVNCKLDEFRDCHRTVFIITDGNPHTDDGYYRNSYAYYDTAKAIEEGREKGIHYIYLTINPDSSADAFLDKIRHTADFCQRYRNMKDVVEGLTLVYEKLRLGHIG